MEKALIVGNTAKIKSHSLSKLKIIRIINFLKLTITRNLKSKHQKTIQIFPNLCLFPSGLGSPWTPIWCWPKITHNPAVPMKQRDRHKYPKSLKSINLTVMSLNKSSCLPMGIKLRIVCKGINKIMQQISCLLIRYILSTNLSKNTPQAVCNQTKSLIRTKSTWSAVWKQVDQGKVATQRIIAPKRTTHRNAHQVIASFPINLFLVGTFRSCVRT